MNGRLHYVIGCDVVVARYRQAGRLHRNPARVRAKYANTARSERSRSKMGDDKEAETGEREKDEKDVEKERMISSVAAVIVGWWRV